MARNILHFPQALLLELCIPNRQNLIYDQNLWLQMRRNCKGEPHIHATAVALDWCIQEFLYAGERDNLVELALNFDFAHAQDGAIEKNVFAAGELGMEAGAYLEQAGDAATDAHPASRGFCDAAENLEQGTLAGPIAADDAQHLALLYFERDIFESPELLARWSRSAVAPVAGVPALEKAARLAREGFTQRFITSLFHLVVDPVTLSELFDSDNRV